MLQGAWRMAYPTPRALTFKCMYVFKEQKSKISCLKMSTFQCTCSCTCTNSKWSFVSIRDGNGWWPILNQAGLCFFATFHRVSAELDHRGQTVLSAIQSSGISPSDTFRAQTPEKCSTRVGQNTHKDKMNTCLQWVTAILKSVPHKNPPATNVKYAF